MKHPKIPFLSLVLLAALTITACGGGGGTSNLAGIGGTGLVAVGQITGFGSVFVNGVEYHLRNNSQILVNGAQADQSALKLGMVVSIDGTLDSSGLATVNRLTYGARIRGPVIDPPARGADGQTATLKVMGMTVQVDAVTTSFGEGYSFAAMAKDDFVEVSGHPNGSGVLVATRIELKTGAQARLQGSNPQFKDQTHFRLENVLVDSSGAKFTGLQPGAGLDACPLVIQGSYDSLAQALVADTISCADDGLPDSAEEAELEGLVDNLTSTGFTLNGIQVDSSQAVLEPSNLSLADSMAVEVEGRLSGSTLKADKIKGRGGDIEVEAYVATDPQGDKIILQITSADTLTVTVDPAQTRLEDEGCAAPPLTISDIHSGDFLEIKAVQDNSAALVAQVIKCKAGDDGEVILQGPVDTPLDPLPPGGPLTLSILGITFSADPTTTGFQQDSGSDQDQSVTMDAFYTTLKDQLSSQDKTFVKIKDSLNGTTAGDGNAEEMEIRL